MSVDQENNTRREIDPVFVSTPPNPNLDRPANNLAEPAPPPLGGNHYGESMGGMGGGAAGAVGGALIGSVIGPAGTVLGGMIGLVAGAAAGAIAGRVGAGVFNPDSEVSYWENHFVDRPYYLRGMIFADYAPAYRYGVEQCRARSGAPYEDLSSGWQEVCGQSRLTWEQAEPAVRDAYKRMAERLEA